MFRVIFCKTVWNGNDEDSSSEMALYKKELSLPFALSPYIEITGLGPRAMAPHKVRWDVEDQVFTCEMGDEFAHSVGVYEYDFEWLTSSLEIDGWKLISKLPAVP